MQYSYKFVLTLFNCVYLGFFWYRVDTSVVIFSLQDRFSRTIVGTPVEQLHCLLTQNTTK